MGAASSKALLEKQKRDVAWAMPAYCIEKFAVTPTVTALVNNSWEYIMSGSSPSFAVAQAAEPALLPVVFFYDTFYTTLFQLFPESRALFTHGLEAQGRMLASMIKFIILPASTYEAGPASASPVSKSKTVDLDGGDDKMYIASLQHLARIHNRIGIDASSYTIMGIVLFHSLRVCLGEAYWNIELETAWIQVFSRLMSVFMPIVVAKELPRGVKLASNARCPATGAGGPNPHKAKSNGAAPAVVPVEGASDAGPTSPEKVGDDEPIASPTAGGASKILVKKKRGKREAPQSESPIFDYRSAAEEMMRAEEAKVKAAVEKRDPFEKAIEDKMTKEQNQAAAAAAAAVAAAAAAAASTASTAAPAGATTTGTIVNPAHASPSIGPIDKTSPHASAPQVTFAVPIVGGGGGGGGGGVPTGSPVASDTKSVPSTSRRVGALSGSVAPTTAKATGPIFKEPEEEVLKQWQIEQKVAGVNP